ncbi:hypothetical protein IWW34DRAFT_638331, partial [Fusarium oxysporum f. sp. albedinis]
GSSRQPQSASARLSGPRQAGSTLKPLSGAFGDDTAFGDVQVLGNLGESTCFIPMLKAKLEIGELGQKVYKLKKTKASFSS